MLTQIPVDITGDVHWMYFRRIATVLLLSLLYLNL